MLSTAHPRHPVNFCPSAYFQHPLTAERLPGEELEIEVKPGRSFAVVDILQSREELGMIREQRQHQILATHHDQHTTSISRGAGIVLDNPTTHHGIVASNVKSSQLRFGIDKILSEDTKPTKKSDATNHYSDEGNDYPKQICLSTSNVIYPSIMTAQPAIIYPTPAYTHRHHHVESGRPYHPSIYSNEQCRNTCSYQGPYTVLTHHEGWRPIHSQQHPKRKRSWSRAVFTNLQRKGLEKRFEVQKYVTKPDRRQLAAALGLTDAQVKVWFQNRRMKWRHSKEVSTKKCEDEQQQSKCLEQKENVDIKEQEHSTIVENADLVEKD